MKHIFSLFLLCSFIGAKAQKTDSTIYDVKQSFLIILSTKSYAEAKKMATVAASKLKIKLDLRGLKPNKESGLTFTPKKCKEDGWEFPAYISRGRYDAGEYVSIEYSDAFKGFAEGYYIVTTASGDADDVKTALAKVKKVYKKAYSKETEVYMGCMH
jgi:hypothetical protein